MRNLKKVIALVAVFAMMVSSFAFAQSYSDVKEDDNYYEAIEMLSKLNILTGDDKDGDGVVDFRPNDTITRAEVAAVVCRVQDLNGLSQATTPFTDVPSSHWASGYVAQAAGQGIINGYGDGNFGPEDEVTYEQAVKMFVETLGYTPFVNVNGGYPSGHLTAAQRYGILDGVVGGSVGAKATRGQVAQIAFNAIDTPIMDRSSYGVDEEFAIYDGSNERDFITLLTRDLRTLKLSGVVKENQVTSFDNGNSIDTDEKAQVKFDIDPADKYNGANYYDVKGKNYTYYAAESGAEDYLGYYVNAFVKETDRSGEYDVIAITPSSKNKTVSFTLDQFDSLDSNTIYYYKNDTDSKTSTLTLEKTIDAVIYNGVAYSKDLSNVFGAEKSGALVEKNSIYSGKVTLIDNDSTNGYDVIKVDIAATGVVDEVSEDGIVSFLNDPTTKEVDSVELDFDEDDNNQIIKLTKDGKAISYTELKKWDVLSIYYAGDANTEYYDVQVINANKLDSYITNMAASKTSANTFEYTIDGNKYDVAAGYYTTKNFKPGLAGVFYIDANNKIVAFDKNGSSTSTTSNGNYAFIINASVGSTGFDKTVSVQMLTKDGKVVEEYLNDKVTFENGNGTALGYKGSETFDADSSYDLTDDFNLDKVKTALKNQFVTYEMASNGYIKTVSFAVPGDEDDDVNGLALNYAAGTYSYDEEDKEIKVGSKSYSVSDDTVVFYIKGDNNATLTDDATATATSFAVVGNVSKSGSKVSNGASLQNQKNTKSCAVAVFDTEGEIAGALVMLDTTGGISDSTGVAVVDSVGKGTYNGEALTTVTYFKDGVEMTSYVDEDIDSAIASKINNANQGDLFKFALSDDGQLITDAELCATVSGRSETDATVGLTVANKQNVVAGIVYDYSSAGKKLKIYTDDTFTTTDTIKAADANVYVIDPNKAKNKIYVGAATSAKYNEDLFFTTGYEVVSKTSKKTLVANGKKALGLMDYAIGVLDSEDDVVDVVIYKAYDFGKYTINKVTASTPSTGEGEGGDAGAGTDAE